MERPTDLVILSSSPLPVIKADFSSKLQAESTSLTHPSFDASSDDAEVTPYSSRKLAGGKHASPLPEGALNSFQRASLLPREESLWEPPETEEKPVKKRGRPKKDPSKTAEQVSKPKAPRAPRAPKVPKEPKKPKEPKEPKKPKEPKEPKKAPAKRASKATEPKKRKGKENMPTNEDGNVIDLTNLPVSPTRRRKSWTPVPGSPASVGTGLTTVLSGFAYDNPPSRSMSPQKPPLQKENSFLKRKRIELMSPLMGSEALARRSSDPRPKEPSPKKKPKTITDMSVEKFGPQTNQPSVQDMFTVEKAIELEQNALAALKDKKGAKRPRKATISKKKVEAKPKLVSPLTAAKRHEAQNIQFGTSSQLAGALASIEKAVPPSKKPPVPKFRFATANTGTSGGIWGAEVSSSVQNMWAAELDQQASKSAPVDTEPVHHSSDFQDIDDMCSPQPKPRVKSPLKIPSSDFEDIDAFELVVPKTLPPATQKDFISIATQNDFIPIDDILDSEPELSPTPPRLPTTPSQLPLTSKSPSKAKRRVLREVREDWEISKRSVFARITKLVTSLPRSQSLREPTWYERMLMYEPIVIEEFTKWLNERGVQAGEGDTQGEVLPWMTQQWCEDQSICCVWKLTNRKTSRKR
ncbi:hypothetical protein BT63DRAFT_424973 [Microthyrium microscopicum]|uniref:Structure-specific endonuclease subunit SLX4 n=1 Tax=Microthyrium microscopicum TaxID=703497 RepID=A0A6A6UDR2_9PEZI|nr:hypothetical protein BT63DRAFT_424973 [Microthyrium microscopicum]